LYIIEEISQFVLKKFFKIEEVSIIGKSFFESVPQIDIPNKTKLENSFQLLKNAITRIDVNLDIQEVTCISKGNSFFNLKTSLIPRYIQ
jgi:hypothetical protein